MGPIKDVAVLACVRALAVAVLACVRAGGGSAYVRVGEPWRWRCLLACACALTVAVLACVRAGGGSAYVRAGVPFGCKDNLSD